MFGGYNPNKQLSNSFLSGLSISLDMYIANLDNLLLPGDFTEGNRKNFCDSYNLANLITEPTCFKSLQNPMSIDVILTNRGNLFQKSLCFGTGISDHHKLTIIVLKSRFKRLEPIEIKYRKYKKCDLSSFKSHLAQSLRVNTLNDINYDNLKYLFMHVLNKHAPVKEKLVRGNNTPFMNKTLSKAFMKRSKLKNKYNKFPNKSNELLFKK